MADNKKVNFKNGLENFLKINFPAEKVIESGLDFLSNLLNDVNATIISNAKTKYDSIDRVNERTLHHCVQSAINENFPENLKKNSLSEAYKQVALLESGCIAFGDNEEELKIKRPTKKSKEQQKMELPVKQFKEGVKKLSRVLKPTIFPGIKVDSQAQGSLAFRMHAFAKMVAKRTAETSGQKEELQPIDVRHVLAEYLGDNILKCAVSQGNRCLVLHENGFLAFKPKKIVVKDQSEESIAFAQKLTTNFKPVIKHMLEDMGSPCEPKTQNYLGHILLDIARYVAKNTSELCKREDISEMKEVELDRSVSQTFPKELGEHALINSNRNVERVKRLKISSESSETDIKSSHRRTRSPKPSARRKKRKSSKSPVGSKTSKKGRSKSPAGSKASKKGRSKSPAGSKTSQKGRTKSPSASRRSPSPKSPKKSKKRPSSQSPKRPKRHKKGKSKSLPELTGRDSDLLGSILDQFTRVNISLGKEASSDLSKVLKDVCEVLIDISVSKAPSSKVLSKEETKAALLELLPSGLSKLALAHASNSVDHYLEQINNA